MAELQQHDDAWVTWFKKHRLDPIPVTYEALAASPGLAVADILSALEMAPEVSVNVEPETAKLADEVSEQWLSRYKAESSVC
ncbi:hypothetical protein MNBD_ALPHA08-2209 [hydrothermal vent metagenome]|uniref:Sulphotransferase Stf0 domain-containing protein n=1 Tax=hydrothermal vent metagenome TaxID=652676 RepID=A0A3B0SRD1_9ZZZZ